MTRSSFLKVSGIVESEIISMKFMHSVTLKLIGIFTILNSFLLMHDFVLQIVPALTLQSSFSCLLCLFDIMIVCFFKSTSYSVTTRCSRLILHIPCPSPRMNHLPRCPGSFYWRMILETNV